MTFTVAPDLAAIVRAGVLWLDGATVVDREARLNVPLAAAEAAIRTNPPEEIGAVRAMYKRVGLDPTKTRPSSEALLRRVRKGDALPRINSMVDVCNWCSLEFQLPYGLYDAAKIEGDVQLRVGLAGRILRGHPQGRRARWMGASRWRMPPVPSATRRRTRRGRW